MNALVLLSLLDLGGFSNVKPQWKGSSYSYSSHVKPPVTGSDEEESKYEYEYENKPSPFLSTTNQKSQPQTLHFSVCGPITMEQSLDRVSNNGTTNTGFELWSSALVMSEYLDQRFAKGAVPCWKHVSSSTISPPICLELGAGLGLPSIVLARHGFRVMATDHEPEVLSLLEQNARNNLPKRKFYNNHNNNNNDNNKDNGKNNGKDNGNDNGNHDEGMKHPLFSVHTLDWANHEAEQANPQQQYQQKQLQALAPDLIIASDVIWNATRPVWDDFLSLLNRLRENRRQQRHHKDTHSTTLPRHDGTPTPHSDPLVLMGYTQRRLDMTADQEGHFFALLRRYGMEHCVLPASVAPYSDRWPLTVLMELRWKQE